MKFLKIKKIRKKQIINEMTGKTKKVIKPYFKIVNREVKANEFKHYFTSIASKLKESLTYIYDFRGLSNKIVP